MIDTKTTKWIKTSHISDFEADGGRAILVDGKQIAIYFFKDDNEWYASDNQCPHQQQQALSRGLIGSEGDEPKVACPFHKKSFSLKSGKCLSGEDYEIKTYPIKIEDEFVFIGLE